MVGCHNYEGESQETSHEIKHNIQKLALIPSASFNNRYHQSGSARANNFRYHWESTKQHIQTVNKQQQATIPYQ